MRVPDSLARRRTPLRLRVARALEKEDARGGGQALDLLHSQDHRTIDHPVDQETVLTRIDIGKATAMDHVVKRGRRDDPQRFV